MNVGAGAAVPSQDALSASPFRVRTSGGRPLGRDDELGVLLRVAEEARRGHDARIVLVSGDAGIGKSTVVDTFVAGLEGARVLRGECLDTGAGQLPYAATVQAIRPVLRDPEQWGVEISAAARVSLSRLVPDLLGAEGMTSRVDALGQDQLVEHLLGVVEQAAAACPLLVLVIEDVHWCDPASRDVLGYLLANLGGVRALVVMTARTTEIGRGHPARPLLDTVTRSPRATRLDLGPLDAAALLSLLRDRVMDARELGDVMDRSGGNPLYALELANGHGALTDQLADLLLARFDGCAQRTKQVLRILAAVGGPVDHVVLLEVSSLAPDELDAAVREAIERHLLIVDGVAYRLRHALIADAIEAGSLPSELLAVHSALADRLLQGGGIDAEDAAELARHLRVAGRRDEELEAAFRAATHARTVFAYRDARLSLERVAELWHLVPDAEARVGTDLPGVMQAASQCALADLDERRTVALATKGLELLGDAEQDRERAAALHTLVGRGHDLDWERSEPAFRTALSLVRDQRTPLRARVEAAFSTAMMKQGIFGEGEALAAHAAEVAEAVGEQTAWAEALITLATIRGQRGDAAESARLFARARRVAEDAGAVVQQMRAASGHSGILANQGAFEAAIEECQRAVDLAEAHGLGRTRGMDLRINLLGPSIDLGRLEEALAIGLEAMVLAPEGAARGGLLTQTGMAAIRSGDVRLARWLMEEADREMASSRQIWFQCFWGQLATEVALAEGNHETAVARVRVAFTAATDPDGPAFWAGEVGALYAEAVRAAGIDEDLDPVVRAVRDRAATGETRVHAGERMRLEAMALVSRGGDPKAVIERWNDALACYEAMPMPQRVAMCLLELGELHLRVGDRPAARTALARAARTAKDIGARPLLRRAKELLARHGLTAPTVEHTGVSATEQPEPATGRWQQTGHGWVIGLHDTSAVVPDAKGVRDIAVLLDNIGHDVHVFDLTGSGVLERRLEVIDDQARRRYARRIVELDERAALAAHHGDEATLETVRAERGWLVGQLRASAGLGHRTRLGADGEEKARQAVGARIRYAIKRIDEVCPDLADHLRRSIDLGVHCRYDPEVEVCWDVRTS